MDIRQAKVHVGSLVLIKGSNKKWWMRTVTRGGQAVLEDIVNGEGKTVPIADVLAISAVEDQIPL